MQLDTYRGDAQRLGDEMPLILTSSDVAAVLDWPLVVEALERGFRAEAEGRVAMPPRLNVPNPGGWIRMMPAVIASDDMPYMGGKVMNLVKGQGTRYLILLYHSQTGELLAIMDAARITQMRTAGTTALAARAMAPAGFEEIGIFGSGFEARGHYEAMAALFPLRRAVVYSPRAERRAAFAEEMSRRTGVPCEPLPSADAVLDRCSVVVLATKATTPVLDGDRIRPGATILSIGSTRPDLRELDVRTLERAARLVVDSREQVFAESGDVQAAVDAGVLPAERVVDLVDAVVGRRPLRQRPEDILVLKTVGTALQDLAVAGRVYEEARRRGLGSEMPGVASLKAFA